MSHHKPSSTIAIIIPTYNEVENCQLLIPAIITVLPTATIVVVDDQSPDGTAQSIKKLQQQFPQLQLVQGTHKQGRGAAVRQGLAYAVKKTKASIFIEMDADFSHRPSELPALIAAVRDSQTVVIASRYLRGGGVENWPVWRSIFSKLANLAITVTTGVPLHDNTNGFRAYPRAAINILTHHPIFSNSYLCLTETAVILRYHGFRLIEIPSIFPNRVRGTSNTSVREISNNTRELLQLYRRYAQGCTCYGSTHSTKI